jgi:hypothetical protein
MAVITSEIVKYDGNSTRKFVIDVAIVMGCTYEFSDHVTVVSDSILIEFFVAYVTMCNLLE